MASFEAKGNVYTFKPKDEEDFEYRFRRQIQALRNSKPVSDGVVEFTNEVHEKLKHEMELFEFQYAAIKKDGSRHLVYEYWLKRLHECERGIAQKKFELDLAGNIVKYALKDDPESRRKMLGDTLFKKDETQVTREKQKAEETAAREEAGEADPLIKRKI